MSARITIIVSEDRIIIGGEEYTLPNLRGIMPEAGIHAVQIDALGRTEIEYTDDRPNNPDGKAADFDRAIAAAKAHKEEQQTQPTQPVQQE